MLHLRATCFFASGPVSEVQMRYYLKPFLLVWLILILGPVVLTAAPYPEKSPDTLVYSWNANVGPLNPHLYSPNQMFGQAMVYEPLVRYSADGKIIPWLAERWESSPNGREYTFYLRRDVRFSDGTPFNAQAVKKNHDTLKDNADRHDWLELIAQMQKTEVVSEFTVKVTLKEAYYPILQDLALVRPIRYLSPTAFPQSGNTADGIKSSIGTGPWKLVESKLGEYDLFERNDHYWGVKPAVRRILVKVIPDPNTRAVAFETGEIDLIYGDGQISLDTFDRFKNDPRYTAAISQPLATRAIAMNSNRGATRDIAVRRAISHAVDKAALIKGVFLNTEIKADTLYPANIPYCDLNLPPYEYGPAKSAELLENAGWKLDSKDGLRRKQGKPLSVDLCFVGNNAVMKSVAEVLQADLAKVGIQVALIGEEQDAFYKRQHEGQFDLIFNDTWGPPYEPHSYVSSFRVPSHADYQAQLGLSMKKELDAMIGKVLVTQVEEKRQALYRHILTALHEAAVYLPISYTTGLRVNGSNLSHVFYGPTKYEIPFEKMQKK